MGYRGCCCRVYGNGRGEGIGEWKGGGEGKARYAASINVQEERWHGGRSTFGNAASVMVMPRQRRLGNANVQPPKVQHRHAAEQVEGVQTGIET